MGFLSGIIGGGLSLIGGLLGSDANEEAADTAAGAQIAAEKLRQQGYEKARQEYREAAQRGIEAIRAGTDTGTGFFQQGIDEFGRVIQPMLNLQETARLSPAQRIALDDLTADANAYVAASGLRGAGRAGVSAVLDQRRRFIADALEAENAQRRARSDAARSALANVTAQGLTNIGTARINEGRDIAGTETGTGQQIGQTYEQGADASARSTADIGQIRANSQLATGQLWGSTLGTIGSIIADETKRDAYERFSGRNVGGLFGS